MSVLFYVLIVFVLVLKSLYCNIVQRRELVISSGTIAL